MQLNISKSGVGVSAGIPGFRVSTGPRGTQLNVGLPGTGLSYRKHLGGKSSKKKASSKPKAAPQAEAQAAPPAKPPRTATLPEQPKPDFSASPAERELAHGLEKYNAGNIEAALPHFVEAAADEAGAAILAAAILTRQPGREFEASQLLEEVVQSDQEFPTELMKKYLADAHLEIEITPNVTAQVPIDGLAATLLLVELYQTQRRVREAIALLEEIEELAGEPVLTLSLCELYANRELWDDIIDRAKNIQPEDDVTLEILIFYGRAMQEKNLHEAAITVFTKALRAKKLNPILLLEARYWRAVSYLEQGKAKQANIEFQKLYAEAPDFRDVEEQLAQFLI